jgi:hypothetical protein
VGDALGLIPATDAEKRKLIGRAMFIAANTEIFGPIVASLVIALFIGVMRRKNSKIKT